MTGDEKLKCAIHCLKVNADMEVCEECEAYACGDLACRDIAREAIKALEEIQMYRNGKLCLVPKDVLKRQCEELDAYKELGTVEEFREAVENAKPQKPNFYATNWYCPKCGNLVGNSEFEWKKEFCGMCGQKIDWSGLRLEGKE